MKGILLDENVPRHVTFTSLLSLFHATDLGRNVSDTAIWQYAREKQLIIITKDADFSNRIMLSKPPPWIVHLRFGNMRKKKFHAFLAQLWPQIEDLLPSHKLVNVFSDRIEAIHD